MLSKQANECKSLHNFLTPQLSQTDSKSGADSSDIPSNISDTDVASGSIGSPVQENVAVNADYVLEPTTQKQTKGRRMSPLR